MANEIIAFSKDLAQQIFESGEAFSVDFDLAWIWLGYSTKANAKKKLVRNFVKGIDYSSIWMNVNHGNGLSASSAEKIMLAIDCFKSLGMMAGTDQGREIRGYFLDCERVARQERFPEKLVGHIEKHPDHHAIETVATAIDLIFGSTGMAPQLVAGVKAEAIATMFPQYRPALEAAKRNLLTPVESKLLCPTELAAIWEEQTGEKLSAIAFNKKLESANLQKKTGNKTLPWQAIGCGIDHSEVVLDTATGHGKTVQRLMWHKSVIDLLT